MDNAKNCLAGIEDKLLHDMIIGERGWDEEDIHDFFSEFLGINLSVKNASIDQVCGKVRDKYLEQGVDAFGASERALIIKDFLKDITSNL